MSIEDIDREVEECRKRGDWEGFDRALAARCAAFDADPSLERAAHAAHDTDPDRTCNVAANGYRGVSRKDFADDPVRLAAYDAWMSDGNLEAAYAAARVAAAAEQAARARGG